jgi:hypothetical protein
MVHRQRKVTLSIVAVTMAFGALVPASADARAGLTIRAAKHAAVVKVKRLERKLASQGAQTSTVPGCWRKSSLSVGCLGIVRGTDEFVRWRCAVPMTIRRRMVGTASTLRRLAVDFTDTMCAF